MNKMYGDIYYVPEISPHTMCYAINIMSADGLAPTDVKESANMVLTKRFFLN